MYYLTECDSPVGTLRLASDGESLTGLWIEGQKYEGGTIGKELVPKDDFPVFSQTKDWLKRYFAGDKPEINELPLAPIGGEFRQGVWRLLTQIPYGEVTTYGALAQAMAKAAGKAKMSAQAVGGAVGHNPISIIVPCHRVVGSNGSLTGYAGGIGIKQRLLQHEGVDMSKLFVPKKGTAL
ncbi:MAG: methylated-DNA--[protein]-cysteine S-methyltransferase [Coriobacteriales bacterium]|jgi:methylated-DNA-[protein]-cysteine S-methyltransferase|nr:methylated-DNA--[protein]-cysteine S-methyltransferase [Coriobacteriales bacterium]